jgi:hypothetical protein
MKRRWAKRRLIGRRHRFTQVERADSRRAGAMSSPARSTVSAASGGAVSAAEDVADSIDALYRKDETMAGDTPLPCASVDR